MQNKRCFIRLAPARIVVLCKIFALRVPQKHRFWRMGFVQVYFIEMLEKSGEIGPPREIIHAGFMPFLPA